MLNLPVFCRVSLVFNRPPFNLLRGCCGMSTSKFAADERSQGLDQSRRDFLVDGWMLFFWVDSKVGTFLLKGNLLYVMYIL